ncbi:ParB/RepB/Spo0J family partition protein [Soehngenia longivitae]|uniref:ParB/RepB/Spo0J family partition protein n=1 Tax=Soehngenia longivitae TaxID=2562294 RepID=A0A4Z0D8Z7_9FIRM|nr:ParB/RepB/Spo0J family partition protein [Soehngenia longivitae]TFZ41312.1 ParB/RepB/Spo0J family partition protein [Soehngenia longivitae]
MVQKRTGLGKGLSALIQDKERVDNLINDISRNDTKILELDIDKIRPKEDQPRKKFDKESLESLAKSIEENGVLQPLLVAKKNEYYEIVAGERRYRASKIANLKKIPCIVREIDEITASKIALIENIQREDLNPIEEAYGYKRIIDEYNLTQEELAKAIGKSRSYVANTIRLLNLDERVIEFIKNDDLTTGHGKVLLGIKDKDAQYKKALNIVKTNSSVRKTEELIDKKKKIKKNKDKDLYIKEVEERLITNLGTKVTINKTKAKGTIEIEFYNEDDLDRLVDLIIK